MLKPVLFVVLILGALSSYNNEKKIQKTLNDWNWDVECWGEENVLQQRKFESSAGEMCNQKPIENPPLTSKISPLVDAPRNFAPTVGAFSYRWRNLGLPSNYPISPYNYPILSHGYRGRRHAFGKGQSDLGFQEDHASRMSNLSCVLQTLTVIGPDLKLNRPLFESEFYKTLDLTATDNLNDPLWRKKMSALWIDCINLAESFPQSSIDRDAKLRKFGPLARIVLFNRCNKESKKKMCAAAQMERLISTYYETDADLGTSGADKYEKAIQLANGLIDSETPNEMFQEEFFHGEL